MEERIKIHKARIKEWSKTNLVGKGYLSPLGIIYITIGGIKETLNQPHKYQEAKILALYDIELLLLKVIAGSNSYIVVREDIQTGTKILYSIVDNIK